MTIDIQKLNNIVRTAAREELLPRFEKVSHTFKADGSVLTEADLAMDSRLKTELHQAWPEIDFLSEEMEVAEQEQLLENSDKLWCLDPLDGTSNFAAGIPYFGVSLALIEKGQVTAGVIYDPILDECFSAVRNQGAMLNGKSLKVKPSGLPLKKAIALVDLKRLSPTLRNNIANHPPFHSQRNFGSCALEWAWMAAGRGHVYLHGGQKLWDLAAGTLLLEEAGGCCTTLEGETIFRPKMAARSVVSSSDTEMFPHWQDWLRSNS